MANADTPFLCAILFSSYWANEMPDSEDITPN